MSYLSGIVWRNYRCLEGAHIECTVPECIHQLLRDAANQYSAEDYPVVRGEQCELDTIVSSVFIQLYNSCE